MADFSVAVLDEGKVAVQHVRLPERSPGEIDIAISAAAICGSDVHTVLGHRRTPPRTALGHEGVGHIADLDDGSTDLCGALLRRGDRVVFSMMSSCGACDRCTNNLPMKCESLVKYGHESVATPPFATGMLATRVRLLPGVPVMRIPAVIADEQVVSAGCAVATAVAIVKAAGSPSGGARVLVFGAGAVGAYTAAMFITLGCEVSVKDPAEDRLALVQSLGATPADGSSQSFSVVVEASGSATAFEDAVRMADLGGRVVAAGSVSPGSTTVTLDPALLVTRRIQLVGIHNYRPEDFRWGVEWLIAHGRTLGLEQLVSPPVPLSAISDGFRWMQEGTYPRVLIQPDD